jgi:threonine synthase
MAKPTYMPEKFHFECVDCNTEYPGDQVIYLCPACNKLNNPGEPPRGVLKTVYNCQEIRSRYAAVELFDRLVRDHFLPILPLTGMGSWPALRVGQTPMYRANKLQDALWDDGVEIYLKDDSQNPTFSFKDRASALVSAWAKENGMITIVAASTGNAGSSLAGICASQGQKAMIVVPSAAPLAKLTQILMYGASLVPVKGTYDDAFDLSVKISEKFGFYNRNTAYNPLTIEGKKSVSFEIFQQLNCQVPDRIFIPVGDGVIYSGVCKGFEDLLMLGIIDHMPVLVAVQAEGSSNLIRNLAGKPFISSPSRTIADSISVDVPRCFHMTASFMEKYHGESLAVSDPEILEASVRLSRSTGIFAEPAASAAYAGMLKSGRQGNLTQGSKNVVLLTGSGLKDLPAVQSMIKIPAAVDADLAAFEKIIGTTPGR